MFDREAFVADCRAALGEAQPILAVKEILDRAVSAPDEIAAALTVGTGVELLHRSDDLTVISVVLPAGGPGTMPHDHRLWAVVGIYGGQEDNTFYRRAGDGLEGSGGRSLHVGDTVALGDDTIHAIRNPLAHSSLAAIHVYGGDLLETPRSMWVEPGHQEQPYDETVVLGSRVKR